MRGARLDPVSLRLALSQECVEGLRACIVDRRRHRSGFSALEARLDLREGQVVSIVDSLARRSSRAYPLSEWRSSKPLRAGAPLEGVSPQLFLLGLVRARPRSRSSAPRRAARSTVHGGGGSHLRYGERSTELRRAPAPPPCTLVLRRLEGTPLSSSSCVVSRATMLPSSSHGRPSSARARSAFFARLRSRRSLTASSRARFACVCCFFAGHPLLLPSRSSGSCSLVRCRS